MSKNIQHLISPINFDTWTERASAAGKLDTNPAGKTPMQKYETCLKEIGEYNEKAKIKPLTSIQQNKLNELLLELPKLKTWKDEIILSQTAITHLKEVYLARRSGVTQDIHSMYMENGKMAEPEAIKLISEIDEPDLFDMGEDIYEKCELPRQKNNHFEGECDIKKSPTVQDTKCCWDIFTFYKHVDELIFNKDGVPKWVLKEDGKWEIESNSIDNNVYYCQGQIYLELYGELEFWLRYCLVDMPSELLEQNYRWIKKEYGGVESDAYFAACKEFKNKHTFSHLPLSSRVVTFKVKRDREKYLDLCRKVEKAREFLNWYSLEMYYFENPSKRESGSFAFGKSNLIENIIDLSSVSEKMLNVIDEVSEITQKQFDLLKSKNTDGSKHNIVEEPSPEIQEKLDLAIHDMVETQKEIELIEDMKKETVDIILGVTKVEDISKPILSEKEENEVINVEENTDQTNQNIKEIDQFVLDINALKTIEDAVEFYMNNSDKIDDTKYEPIFNQKRDELSAPVEAPKPKLKTTQSVSKSEPTTPEKVYTGNEKYNVKDGVIFLVSDVSFEDAKNVILSHLVVKFKEWLTYKDHRNEITKFYHTNKEIISRDQEFFVIVSEMSKKECDRLNEIEKKKLLDQVNKM